MKIHEYQARSLFSEYGIAAVRGEVASSPEEAARIAERMGCAVVVKAQVLAGGRGKAGGVKTASSPSQARQGAGDILAMSIKGYPVKRVLVTEALKIENEYYLGITIDRRAKKPALIASAAGGVDIEELAAHHPEQITTLHIDPR